MDSLWRRVFARCRRKLGSQVVLGRRVVSCRNTACLSVMLRFRDIVPTILGLYGRRAAHPLASRLRPMPAFPRRWGGQHTGAQRGPHGLHEAPPPSGIASLSQKSVVPIEALICGGLRWGDTAIAGRARCRYGHSIESRRGFCHRPWTTLVGPDHPARFLAAFVDDLDAEAWGSLGTDLKGDPMGAGAYHPHALLSIWLYGFMTGVRSTRKLEAACRDQVPYRWLAAMQKPNHNTLWRFYQAHRDRMRGLRRRTVRTAVTAGLVDLAVQAVDGIKIAGDASRDRTYDGGDCGGSSSGWRRQSRTRRRGTRRGARRPRPACPKRTGRVTRT